MAVLSTLKVFSRRRETVAARPSRRWSVVDLAQRHPQRLDVLAIVVSLLLHAFLIGGYFAWKPLVFARAEASNPPQQQEKLLAFRLVETPESARLQKPPRQAAAVSDKNARAQNRKTPQDLPEGEAFAPVKSDVFAQGGPEGVETGKTVVPPAGAPLTPTPPQPSASEEQKELPKPDGQMPSVLRRFAPPKFSREAIGQPMQPQIQPRAGGGRQDSKSRFIGDFSLNTYAWDYAPYILYMKRRMASNLYPPPAFTRLGIIHGSVVLHFKVMPNGEVRDLEVESYDCHPSLVETSLQAVRNSSPFKPLPRDFPEPFLELRWTFMYVVYGPDGRPQQ